MSQNLSSAAVVIGALIVKRTQRTIYITKPETNTKLEKQLLTNNHNNNVKIKQVKPVLGGMRIVALPLVLMNRLNKTEFAVF